MTTTTNVCYKGWKPQNMEFCTFTAKVRQIQSQLGHMVILIHQPLISQSLQRPLSLPYPFSPESPCNVPPEVSAPDAVSPASPSSESVLAYSSDMVEK